MLSVLVGVDGRALSTGVGVDRSRLRIVVLGFSRIDCRSGMSFASIDLSLRFGLRFGGFLFRCGLSRKMTSIHAALARDIKLQYLCVLS